MKYKGYWSVDALTSVADSRLAGGRRQTLTPKCGLLYQALGDAAVNLFVCPSEKH